VKPNEVRVEMSGNRILLASGTPTPGLKHSIPGAYFRREGVWSVPLDLVTCKLLRERFGNRLTIGPNLRAWAIAEKAAREQMEAIGAAADADLSRLPEVAPALFAATSTRTYQRSGIRFVVDSRGRDDRRRALLADTVGLGKTAQAIGSMLESGEAGPYLVVCPKTPVLSTWLPEIKKWLGDDARVITLPDQKAKRTSILRALAADQAKNPTALARTWLVINPEVVRTQTWWICGQCGAKTKFKAGMVQELDTCGHEKDRTTKVRHDHAFHALFEIEWGGIIADESDQSLIRLTGTPNLRRRGMEMLRDNVRPGGIRLAMSGTPFRSKPHQIWSTLNWLDPVRFSSKWNFLGKFWQLGGYSGYTVGDFIEGREELLIDELRDIMVRRTRDMVRDDFPEKDYPSNIDEEHDGLTKGIYLPMTEDQERAYRQMEKEGEALLEGGTLQAVGVLAELTRLKQFAGAPGWLDADRVFHPKAAGNKYEWLVEFLTNLGFPDKPATKLVVASQFTQLLNVFAEGVAKDFKDKIGLGMITGETKHREQIVAAFEDADSGLDLLFINTKAGGSSITLDAAEIMVVLDETWVADEQEQLEGRIDNRLPEKRIVPRSYYYLRSRGTVEEGIARKNAAAKARGEAILNGAAIARAAKEVMVH
jgi:SNF2-related domain